MRIVVTYDPSNRVHPLNAELPEGMNPMMAALMLLQVVLAIIGNFGGLSNLIVPGANLPKIQ